MYKITLETDGKIQTIKAIRQFGGFDLKTAKDMVEQGFYVGMMTFQGS